MCDYSQKALQILMIVSPFVSLGLPRVFCLGPQSHRAAFPTLWRKHHNSNNMWRRAQRSSSALARPATAALSGRVAMMSSAAKLSLKTLAEQQSLRGKRVLVRADLNVPFKKNHTPITISDDTRIRAVLPTLKLLQEAGARTVLCSHLGRPEGQVNEQMRLTPVAARLSELLGNPVTKLDDCIGDNVTSEIEKIQDGEIVLLENVRFYKQETKNDPEFAKKLAHDADVYVNDAFGTAHRAHASTEGVTKYVKTSVAGFLMEKELKYLAGAVDAPVRPLGAIVGGAKVSRRKEWVRSCRRAASLTHLSICLYRCPPRSLC